MHSSPSTFDFPPYRLSGTVYGVLLNHAPALVALGAQVNEPPYKAPPKAPVLYVKPRNTLAGSGAVTPVPADGGALLIGANLGVVIARAACHVAEPDALSYVAGYVIVDDLSVAHTSFYRPSVRHNARDRSCVISRAAAAQRVRDANALAVRVFVDGRLVHSTDTGQRIRPLARLLADVTDFMTLSAGDVLMLGCSAGAPAAGAGSAVAIEIDGLGRLEHTLAAEAESQHAHATEPHA